MRSIALYTSCTLSCILFLMVTAGCQKEIKGTALINPFRQNPTTKVLPRLIREASGIADSKLNPGNLWVEEDSGNPPFLYLLSHQAEYVKGIYLKGATNRDWEDICLANGPVAGKNYLYVGEIGDNNAVHASSSFYRLEEPSSSLDTVYEYDQLRYQYVDGPRDAEAFLVDPASKDIFIISKRDSLSRIYSLPYPQSTSTMATANFIQELPYNSVVSAAISRDGKEILVKTYLAVYYYQRKNGETIPETLKHPAIKVDYQVEPQGEAISFALDGKGFYTLSEAGFTNAQTLYFYPRK
ncbi:MAG: PE-PGRS family protein [Terrimonas sp.]|nr:PE-PGRS family protein [Terrimonas sp.]